MSVQGFWFGSKLVREVRISPGNVMAVFWARLTASSNLQMCIPQFIVLAKGKFAMAAFLELLPPGQVKVFFPPSLLRYGGSGLPNIRVDS